jgi:hypothetical protein
MCMQGSDVGLRNQLCLLMPLLSVAAAGVASMSAATLAAQPAQGGFVSTGRQLPANCRAGVVLGCCSLSERSNCLGQCRVHTNNTSVAPCHTAVCLYISSPSSRGLRQWPGLYVCACICMCCVPSTARAVWGATVNGQLSMVG